MNFGYPMQRPQRKTKVKIVSLRPETFMAVQRLNINLSDLVRQKWREWVMHGRTDWPQRARGKRGQPTKLGNRRTTISVDPDVMDALGTFQRMRPYFDLDLWIETILWEAYPQVFPFPRR